MGILGTIAKCWRATYRPVIYIATLALVWAGAVTDRPMSLNIDSATQMAFDTIERLPEIRAAAIAETREHLANLKDDGEPETARKRQELEILLRDQLANPKGVFLICFDFDPGCDAEMGPQVTAILRHCFSRGVKVLMNVGGNVMSLPLAQKIISDAALDGAKTDPPYEFKQEGVDYVFLGFRPNPFQVYLQMGESIISAYETDFAGKNLTTLPMMEHIRNYGTIDAIFSVSAYVGGPETWITIGNAKYKKAVILGMGAIGATDYFPFLHSKQIQGLLPGVRGAAEYETALKCPGDGSKRMWSQLYAHSLAIFLICLGNVEYFFSPKRRRS